VGEGEVDLAPDQVRLQQLFGRLLRVEAGGIKGDQGLEHAFEGRELALGLAQRSANEITGLVHR
jgi:hypothetical protein